MPHRLTETFIKKIDPPEKGQRLYFDDHRDAPRGFALRVTPATASGKVRKAFVLSYYLHGREGRYTIGA